MKSSPTAIDSEAELVLNDETKLAVGPESRIVLDSFIYDPEQKDGEVIINAAKGTSKGASEHKSSGLIRT